MAKEKGIENKWLKHFPWDEEVEFVNHNVFKNESFRECQREIINATMSGRDVIALIPTGGGKSLTFQLPAAISDKKVTFVIMPLISLIEDNLAYVRDTLGLPAVALTSQGKTKKEEKKNANIYGEIRNLQHFIVYLTPEKLTHSNALINMMDQMYANNHIARFVIDEVHCVSHWGQDFRKDYLSLSMLKERFPKTPVLGLTATATIKVKDDINKRLGMKDTIFFQSSFNRPNLFYEIRDKKATKNALDDLVQMIKARYRGQSGIIYCITRKDCERLAETL